ncbi:MAG: hypothetical protein MR691_11940 [Clostridium sp.]|nr:hypothetical protein [Clostridium sp.]
MKNIFTMQEIEKENILYFDNIQEGFEKYENTIIEGSEEFVNNIIRNLYIKNTPENSFADFYYGRLKEEEREKVKLVLNENEIKIIEDLNLGKDEIFLRLNNEILEILLKLTAKEILFSTFYFTKSKCTIWGNYNMKYPIFFKNNEAFMELKKEIYMKE